MRIHQKKLDTDGRSVVELVETYQVENQCFDSNVMMKWTIEFAFVTDKSQHYHKAKNESVT